MSPDGKTWTFRLRKAARWSNGDPITAADFLFSYERMLRPSFGAEYGSMLHGIRGAKDFAAGKTKDFRSVGVRAPDAHTLVIELAHPIPYFLQLICHHSWIPVHPPTILKFGAIDALNTPWTRPGSMVSSGAFTLESWEVARRVVVRKNPLYWNAKEVALNAVEFRAIADLFAEERAFRGGELHVTGAVPPYKVARAPRGEGSAAAHRPVPLHRLRLGQLRHQGNQARGRRRPPRPWATRASAAPSAWPSTAT
jgi:oligopeptide transport system substrate-binding protein